MLISCHHFGTHGLVLLLGAVCLRKYSSGSADATVRSRQSGWVWVVGCIGRFGFGKVERVVTNGRRFASHFASPDPVANCSAE